MEKCVECHDYKVNHGRTFKFTKFSFIDFFLTDRGTAKIGQWQIPQLSISFSAERNANTKATEYVTFDFSFSVLVFFPF